MQRKKIKSKSAANTLTEDAPAPAPSHLNNFLPAASSTQSYYDVEHIHTLYHKYPHRADENNKRKRIRRKKKKKILACCSCRLLIENISLLIFFTFIGGLFFIISFGFVYMVQNVSDPHSFVRKQRYVPLLLSLVHYDLYEKTFVHYHENVIVNRHDGDGEDAGNIAAMYYGNNNDGDGDSNGNSRRDPENETTEKILYDNDFVQKIDLSTYYKHKLMDKQKNDNRTNNKSSSNKNNKCDITVVFMDPRIPDSQPGSPIYYALESVAIYIPNACVLIQTSKCIIEERQSSFSSTTSITSSFKNRPEIEIYQSIYNSSFPLFRTMIENGQVRVTFLNHEKYNLKSCNNYYNPSNALFNYNYWKDEFIQDLDSDFVLIMQSDSILCHSLDIQQYKQYAFVGAVWPKVSSLYHVDFCVSMPIWFKTWTLAQRKWEKTRSRGNDGDGGDSKMYPKPDFLLDSLDFPNICEPDDNTNTGGGVSIAPVGNGGFSLRSRKYMMKAIEICPHKKFSGLNNMMNKTFPCQVVDPINEDLYFAIILLGIRAPLPSGFEAALFSVEMLWPEQSIEMYGGPKSFREQRDVASRFWGIYSSSLTSSAVYQGVFHKGKYHTVPVGMHKPWMYQEMDLLRSKDVLNQCPLLRFIIPPDYHNATDSESQWL